jgi:HEXXH motif-containing protein
LEEAIALVDWAGRAEKGDAATRSRLVARIADAGILAELAPRGRIPSDISTRTIRHGRMRLARLAEEIPLVVLPWLPTGNRPADAEISFAEDPDFGRPASELEIPDAGVRFVRLGSRKRLCVARELPLSPLPDADRVPTTGAVLRSSGNRVLVGSRDVRFDSRVRHALQVLEAVWPRAVKDVCSFAWRVVPVTDRSMVSYSSARRPGVLYIHVGSRPSIRLAEDLLHETVHVRVHALESLHSLVVPCAPDGEPPRFWSPWRQEWRPVRGLLHGACTFTAGEEFFERSLRAGERGALRLTASRRRWLARRLLEERESVAIALRVLAVARRRGYLTPEGRRLLDTVRRTHGGLSRSAGNRRRELATTRAGRRELETFGEWKAAMAARPLRWGW